jgi:4-deoxy-L-threo-5-hexosulose-uronate ketol-isomerase
MQVHYCPGPKQVNVLTTEELRESFLVQNLFQRGQIVAHYTDVDRMVVGGASPTAAPLALENFKETGTSFFLERRELGVLNLAAPGIVSVGGRRYELGTLDCLYIGLGERDISFESGSSGQAAFYFVSAPAHAKHPTTAVRRANAQTEALGEATQANRRRINKLIHPDGVKSSQLVMGFTELEPGSVWNTMPAHTHRRRTEVYFYFDMPDQMVIHLMGEPHATRHLIVRDREAVLSPSWSMHAGCGTASYRFVWAMAGENQVFADMDPAPISELR